MLSVVPVKESQKGLSELVEKVNHENKPVQITKGQESAVLVSQKEWQAIREILALVGDGIKTSNTQNSNNSERVINQSTKISWDKL